MRTVLILAAGLWFGRKISKTLNENERLLREVEIRKALEKFIQNKLPNLSPKQRQKEIKNILGPSK